MERFKWLTDLKLLRVSLVDEGGNPGAHVVMTRGAAMTTAEIAKETQLEHIVLSLHRSLERLTWADMEDGDRVKAMKRSAKEFVTLVDALAKEMGASERMAAEKAAKEISTLMDSGDSDIISTMRALWPATTNQERSTMPKPEENENKLADAVAKVGDADETLAERDALKAKLAQAEERLAQAEASAKSERDQNLALAERIAKVEEARLTERLSTEVKDLGIPVEDEKVIGILRACDAAGIGADVRDVFGVCARAAAAGGLFEEKGAEGHSQNFGDAAAELESLVRKRMEDSGEDEHVARVSVYRNPANKALRERVLTDKKEG